MRRLAIAIASVLAVLLAATAASGELTQKGNLRVTFDGQILPHSLPRTRPAPVTVQIEGEVGTVDGSRPPSLREISVAVNRAGKIYFAGLPTCSASDLQQTSTEAALDVCGDALVGQGHFAANVDFPGAPLIPAQGRVLAFYTRAGGRPGMLLHLYGASPVRATFVLPFKISRRSKGEFGTVFSTRIPEIAADLGYVTKLDLSIGRKYRYAGEQRSFISASCAAPAGFPGGVFELAKATFSFGDGRSLSTSLARDCTVR